MKLTNNALWTSAALVGLALVVAVPATADQVILDDLIVDGSACIGFDCVNGESFGFDTIRIKENNLRIKAQDTSTSASFPTNDWQITFNDSSNGGQNKFSIDDIDGGRTPFTIEASAPSHSLYVDDGGRIGFGTSTPVVDLHVKSGNTPTLRLEQDGSSGFTPQTWDVAGNEANFFIRDATNGSTLPFRIFPGSPSNALNIDSDGEVGIGTTSADAKLHVVGGILKIGDDTESGTRTIRISNDQNEWLLQNNGTTGLFSVRNASSATTPFKIETGAPANSLELTATGVEIEGGTALPDYVFEPDFELLTIAEHADYMWSEKHLPAVGAATTTGEGRSRINVLKHSAGMLEELEVAHIYIAQLNESLEAKEAELAALAGRNDEITRELAALREAVETLLDK
jgi:hypothetical protein